MLVSPPWVVRVQRVPAVAFAALVLLICTALLASLPSSASAAKLLTVKTLKKKTAIQAPKANKAVRGTLSSYKACGVRFPAAARSVRITTVGPIGTAVVKGKKRKLKTTTRRLKTVPVRGSGKRRVRCTWKTTRSKDGKYRFTVAGKVRVKGKYRSVKIKRAVTVRNSRVSAASSDTPQLGVGNTRFISRLESQWDGWITSADPSRQRWMKQHMWRVVGHSTFFDNALKWAPPTLVYKDLYAIYRGDNAKLAAHPEGVLKGADGGPMSIPWGCNPGPCPQYAGDIGSPSFRSAWIAEARELINRGYRGLWIDDANIEMRIGDAKGADALPIDPRTGKTMTFADWRRYIAEFLEQIRTELPQAEITANVLWFGGTSIGRDADPFVQRAYTAVDRLNLERGFNDDGLTNGSAPKDIWSVDSFMAFIDRMHDRGVPVTLDSYGATTANWEYNLAGYFLVDRGEDAVGEGSLKPGAWWNGWDVKLGPALGDRTRRADGVYTRAFEDGIVVLNPPRGSSRTIQLPSAMKRIDGSSVTSVTLPPARGAVLLKP